MICNILKSFGQGGIGGFESLSVAEEECEESDMGEADEGEEEAWEGGREKVSRCQLSDVKC